MPAGREMQANNFAPAPPTNRPMDTDQAYLIFTNPRVVTSMILIGMVLGIVLSLLVQNLAGEWYMPTLFVGICLAVALAYMYWLDRQDWRED